MKKDIADHIRRIGDDFLALADLMEGEQSTTPPEDETDPLPKLEDVRAVLADISRAGKTAEMRELLTKFGAAKLSEVKASDYPALLTAAREIQNA